MPSLEASKIAAYAIAAVSFSVGVGLLTGLIRSDLPAQVRYTCGAVLLLLGIYRYVVTRLQPKPSKWRRFTNVDDQE